MTPAAGVPAQHLADLRGPPGVPGRAGGGLRPGRDDHRARAPGQRGGQRAGPDAQVVHRDRHRGEAHRRDQVEGDRVAGILDDHPVRGGEPGGEDPLDPVQRPAGDGQAGGVDAVGGQLPGRQAAQPRRDRRLGVHPGRPPGRPGREQREQVRVRAAGDQVPGARGGAQVHPRADRGSTPDAGARPAGAGGEAPAAQVAVGGGHRGRADAQLPGQLADRRAAGPRGPAARCGRPPPRWPISPWRSGPPGDIVPVCSQICTVTFFERSWLTPSPPNRG